MHKYRLILDESIHFGTIGRTGLGLTESYNARFVSGVSVCSELSACWTGKAN